MGDTWFVETRSCHMNDSIASLIAKAETGEQSAADTLFTLLYAELHRLAKAQLARTPVDATLGTTTLLHEAYIKMSRREEAVFPDRARFMAYAARAMRGLILNYARDRQAQKRGGELQFTPMNDALTQAPADREDLEQIGAALDELATLEPRLAQVVELKFFCGFSFEEIARMWKVSDRTVQRDWVKARIYLHAAIGREIA
jgi:RNA polymerase sigma factor (TIGR02999 family)